MSSDGSPPPAGTGTTGGTSHSRSPGSAGGRGRLRARRGRSPDPLESPPPSPTPAPAAPSGPEPACSAPPARLSPPAALRTEPIAGYSRDTAPSACGMKTRSSDDHEGPPPKVRRISQDQDDTDGETCPICLEPWSNSGLHRLVCLKCGHCFGMSCVKRWLLAKPAAHRSCPTCKTKCTVKDIRPLYARKLVTVDNAQIAELQTQVSSIQAEKNRVELELQKLQITHRACMRQLEVLRSTLMKSQTPQTQNQTQPKKSWRFALERNLEITRNGGCRVMTYNCRTYEIYVSQKSTNPLFPGYGIRKVNCVDNTLGQFVHLHSKAIRDMTYSQPRDLLLSVGLDGAARIVERGIAQTTIQAGFPLWSCSWDYLRSNEFYVGGAGGVVQQYDVRNPRSCLHRLQAETLAPVISLQSTEFGVLSCQLTQSWLFWDLRDLEVPVSFPLPGACMSLIYDNESHRVLVSCRPTDNGERARLDCFRLRTQPYDATSGVQAVREQSFPGSIQCSVMSRPCWVKAGPSRWAAAYCQSDSSVNLHGLDGARSIVLTATEPAVDLLSLQLNGETILAALSDQRLRVYKAIAMN